MVISSAATAARTEDTAEAASLEAAEEERPSWKLGWLANDLGE